LLHGCGEDHHRAEVDLASEKAHRRWGRSPPASLHRTAEAQPFVVAVGAASRLAGVVGNVEASAAKGASSSLGPDGQIFIESLENAEEPGVLEQSVAQARSLYCRETTESPPPELQSSSVRGC
jgi:hypothetical protein